MTKYTLTYFNYRGKAEVPRLLFAAAGVEYEDVRYEYENWANDKSKVDPPFGSLPLLTVDGETFSQSHAIARYLAEKFGFAGNTDLEKLRACMIAHCCEDMALAVSKSFWEPDPARKAEIAKDCREAKLPVFLSQFEKILKENRGGDGFFVGNSLTWADLTFFHYVTFVFLVDVKLSDIIKSYPKLEALFQRIEKIPEIAAWLAKRPVTPH